MPQLPDTPASSPSIHSSPPAMWKELLPIAIAGMIFGAVWSVLQGQDINWDFRNYYYYDAYAWLHQRVTYNIVPAQMQTWLNPLVFLPKYFLINHTSPMVAGMLFGLFEGMAFAIVYAIARCIIQIENRKLAIGLCLIASIGGITAPQFLEGLGRTSNDNTVSMFALLGVLSILWSIRPGLSSAKQACGFALSGLLLGIGTGFKLTCEVYAVGLTVSLLVLWTRLRFTVRSFVLYAVGGIVGFLLTGGYWSYFLWHNYQNPILPYYNAAFHSDWVLRLSYRDTTYLTHNLQEAITSPFLWFTGQASVGGSQLRDARFALLSILLPIVLLVISSEWIATKNSSADRSSGNPKMVDTNTFWLLLLFSVVSYIYWLKMFSIQRYLVPLCLLSGLILFLLIDRLLDSNVAKAVVFAFLVLFSVVWTVTDNTERVAYDKDWFGVQLSAQVTVPNTLFIMAGGAPMSYIVPFLPESDRFVRVSSNLPMEPDTRLFRTAQEIIKNHSGPIRSLTSGELTAGDLFQLARFGLEIDNATCSKFSSKADQFSSCLVKRDVKQAMLSATPQSHLITWYVPDATDARVYLVEENGKRLFATGAQGVLFPGWLTSGQRFVFELNDWTGTTDGPLLVRISIHENGSFQTERFTSDMRMDKK